MATKKTPKKPAKPTKTPAKRRAYAAPATVAEARASRAAKRPAAPKPTRMVRQGDVLLIRVDALPAGLEPAPADARGVVLAEGETSAHYHAVVGSKATLRRFTDRRNADRVLVVDGPAELRVVGGGSGTVDRHTPIAITAGTYLVRTQRAWDSAASRQVTD